MSKIIGLTGQSGAGKTTVSDTFRNNGFAVINCDITARKVTETGSDCNKELSSFFPCCFDEQFTLDRQKLAKEVFSDKNKLKKLDAIIYPHIISEIRNEIKLLSDEYEYIVLDAPTLFEAGADRLCDIVVSVTAEEKIRFERIKKRDNIDEKLIEKRFSSQHTEEFFEKKSDFIIRNNSGISDAVKDTLNVIEKIKGRN